MNGVRVPSAILYRCRDLAHPRCGMLWSVLDHEATCASSPGVMIRMAPFPPRVTASIHQSPSRTRRAVGSTPVTSSSSMWTFSLRPRISRIGLAIWVGANPAVAT